MRWFIIYFLHVKLMGEQNKRNVLSNIFTKTPKSTEEQLTVRRRHYLTNIFLSTKDTNFEQLVMRSNTKRLIQNKPYVWYLRLSDKVMRKAKYSELIKQCTIFCLLIIIVSILFIVTNNLNLILLLQISRNCFDCVAVYKQ